MTIVVLSWQEAFFGAMIGIRRQIEAVRRELPDRHGANSDDGWRMHIEGACGEMAYAKGCNRFWTAGVNTYKGESDMPGGIEIRTRSSDHYDLIVRADDSNDRYYILVIGRCPRYRLIGGIWGSEAKARNEWVQSYGGREPAWFVPQSELGPLIPGDKP